MQTKQIVVEVPENMMVFFEELMDKLSIPMVDKHSLDEPIPSGLSEEDLDESISSKSPTELQIEIIQWLTLLPSEKVGEVYTFLSPLLKLNTKKEETVWDEVVKNIYTQREASKVFMQQKFNSLAWEDE